MSNVRQSLIQQPYNQQAIIVSANYTCAQGDTSIEVVQDAVTVTLPQAPVEGVTIVLFEASAAFNLSGGAFAPLRTDPMPISQGESFLAVYTILGWSFAGLVTASGRPQWSIAQFDVDPQNGSGNASDQNSGLPGHPILTTVEFNKRTFNAQFVGTCQVNYLSDDISGATVDPSTWLVTGTLTFQGTRTSHHTGALSAVQAAVPSTNTRQTVTDGVFNFATNLWRLLMLTSGASTGNSVWLISGTTSPSCTQPTDLSGVFAGKLLEAKAAYAIYSPSNISFGPGLPAGSAQHVVINDFAIGGNGGATVGVCIAGATYNRCLMTVQVPVGGTYQNCFFQIGVNDSTADTPAVPLILSTGALLLGKKGIVAPSLWSGPVVLRGNVYVTGYPMWIGPSGFAGPVLIDSMQGQDMLGSAIDAAIYIEASAQIGNPPQNYSGTVWGNGNSGYGLFVCPGATATLNTAIIKITGATNDVAFYDPNAPSNVQTSGRYWDETAGAGAGAYSALIALSWAKLATATGGGGFGNQAHDVVTNAALVLNSP